MKKITFLILLILTLSIFGIHLVNINQITTPIDHIENALKPIKPLLANRHYISVIYDTTDVALFYYIQLVLAPTILETEKINTDTILIIENNKNKKFDIQKDNYNILSTNYNDKYNAILVTKKH